MLRFPRCLFVTGTDTNVGKTVVSALLTLGLGAAYWKPIQSGLDPITDTDFVRAVTQLAPEHFWPERFRLTEPLSPHAAAALENAQISLSDFQIPAFDQPHLIIEGAGGLMVPLNDQDFIIDLIKYLQVSVCLVTRSSLGTINHTLLSLAALRHYQIPIFAVIMNGPPNPSNRQAIEHYGQIQQLGELDQLPTLDPIILKAAFQKLIRDFQASSP